MTILVTGKNGQLGSEIQALKIHYPNFKFIFTDVETLDITNTKAVMTFFENNSVQMLINCAAYTAVDKAESEPELAEKVNLLGVKNLVAACLKSNAGFIHISTDYVFDGESSKPYTETDSANPKSVYGRTKLAGEKALTDSVLQNSMIVRTSWVYSSFGGNFVKTMLRLSQEKESLSIIADQVGTPTYAKDLAQFILDAIPKLDNTRVQIYNYTNEGVCSWYDFAKAIFEIKAITIKINAIETSQYPTAAQRPFYSVLNKSKIKETFKTEVPYWRASLINCLQQL